MTRYAERTTVPSSKSRTDIENVLRRHGATGFIYGWAETRAVVGFQMQKRQIKFYLPMPDPNAREFTHTPELEKMRSAEARETVYEQAMRQRWRALYLVIRAKLEAVESGITLFEEEFLAHIVLPDGFTVGQTVIPTVNKAYLTGEMQPLLPEPGARARRSREHPHPGKDRRRDRARAARVVGHDRGRQELRAGVCARLRNAPDEDWQEHRRGTGVLRRGGLDGSRGAQHRERHARVGHERRRRRAR